MNAHTATTHPPASSADALDPTDLTDPDAFGRWYQQHWHRFVALARHLTDDPAVAEDVAADALLRSWQRWQVAGLPERPFAYVAAAIRNQAVSHVRRAILDRRRLERLDRPVAPSPEGGVVDRELVRALLPLLSPTERTAVALYYLDDLPSGEVAERLSVPPVTLRSHLHRARRRMAAQVAA